MFSVSVAILSASCFPACLDIARYASSNLENNTPVAIWLASVRESATARLRLIAALPHDSRHIGTRNTHIRVAKVFVIVEISFRDIDNPLLYLYYIRRAVPGARHAREPALPTKKRKPVTSDYHRLSFLFY